MIMFTAMWILRGGYGYNTGVGMIMIPGMEIIQRKI
jgi:hypothetical protein